MILRRVRIEGYQTLRNPIELADLGVGLHLVHGPNETGKSTLVAAIARAFFDRYNTTDQEMRRLRPWGTELAPKVTVEFESRGKRYRLEKRFLDEEASSLFEWTGNRYERVADSVRADDRVRELLSATASKVGAAGLQNWGLARLLWLPQGSDRLDPPELDETLKQRLLGALGSAVLSPRERAFLERLEREYDLNYTAAKQTEKKGSPLAEARERLARAERDLQDKRARWDEATRLNETVAQHQARLAEIEAARQGRDLRMRELRARAEQEAALESRLKLKEGELTALRDRAKALSGAQSELRELRQQLAAREAELAAGEPRLAALSGQERESQARLAQAQERLSERAAELDALSRRLADGARAAESHALEKSRGELAALLEAVSGLERERLAKAQLYQARKRPKDSDVQDVLGLEREVQSLAKRIEDLGIEVRFTPERGDHEATWSTPDAEPQSAPLSAGQCAVFRSSDSGELRIPGVGTIVIRSGAQDSRRLKSAHVEAKTALAARLELFGVADSEELRRLRAETAEIESEGLALRSSLNAAVAPRFKSITELQAAHEELIRRCAAAQPATPDALAAGEVQELSERLKLARVAHQEAELAARALEAQLKSVAAEARALGDRLRLARETAGLLGTQLDKKIQATGGPETLDKELREAILAQGALEAECGILRGQLPPELDRAARRIAAAELELGGERQREQQARQELDRASALLEAAQGEGYYSKLAAAEEECALARERLGLALERAHAIKCLRRLAQARRERMNSGLMAPVENAATRVFSRIRGTEGGWGAELERLSMGTREQAMLALRLAFGELLSERGESPEPHLIVLDDPLVNADSLRQERARAILAEAAKKLQILVLTARPEDYRGLAPKEYDLAALKELAIV